MGFQQLQRGGSAHFAGDDTGQVIFYMDDVDASQLSFSTMMLRAPIKRWSSLRSQWKLMPMVTSCSSNASRFFVLGFKQQFVIWRPCQRMCPLVIGHNLFAADFLPSMIGGQQYEFDLRFEENAHLYFGFFHNCCFMRSDFNMRICCLHLWKSAGERHTSLNICATSSAVIFSKSCSSGVMNTPPMSTDAGLLNRLASPSAV